MVQRAAPMVTGLAGHDTVEARLHIFRKIKLTIFMPKYRGSFIHRRRTQPVAGERHAARGDIRNKKGLDAFPSNDEI